MDISYIDEFLYLAETLSFKRTAERFFVSRSVISRHVAALEEAVGARLLDRNSHGVQLTNAGEVFYRDAKVISRDWSMALERVHGMPDEGYLMVRLGYLRNAARPVLASFVREMGRRHPNIRLSLVCMEHKELMRALAEHAVDVALAVNVSPDLSRDYRSSPIYRDHFTIACAKDHPFASKGEGVSIDELRGQSLLMPDSYVYGGNADFIGELIDESAMTAARSFYEDADMLTLKVETEGMLAFSSTVNNEIFRNRLVTLPISDVDTSFQVSAFYHDELTGPAFEACCEVFEWCNDSMCEWYPDLALNDCP